MAIDLVNLASQSFPPQRIGALARAVGVSEAVAQKLAAAAIPTVLAALAAAASAPSGARKVRDAVANSGPDAQTKLAGAIDSGAVAALNEGANMLGALLGGSGLSTLAGALGQYAGAPPAAAQSVIGAVVQSVIGTIARQDPSSWSDGSSVASLLNSQKGAISAALPPELLRPLAASGLDAGLGTAARPAPRTVPASAAAARARAAAPATPSPAPARPSGGGFPMWAIIVLIIIVLAAIWWWVSQNQKPAEPAKQGAAPATVEFAAGARMIPHWG